MFVPRWSTVPWHSFSLPSANSHFFCHIFPSLFGFLPRLHPLTTLQESPSAAQATRPRKDPNQEKPIIEKNTAPCNLVISSPLHHTCITLDQVLCRVLTCPFMRPVHELAACGLIQRYSNYTSTITLGTLAAMVLPGPGPENWFSRFSSSCMRAKTARDAAFKHPRAKVTGTGNMGLACASGMWSMHIDILQGPSAHEHWFFGLSARKRRGLVVLRAVITVLEILW